jgi:hypothetical protein
MKNNLNLIKNKYSEEELEENIKLFKEFDWYLISYSQNLSEEFIRKHIDKIDIELLIENKNISEDIKIEIKDLIEII